MGIKGAAGREKLQRDLHPRLANSTCRFAKTSTDEWTPQAMTMEEAKGTSLERFGGFGQNRELGLMMWALARIFNHASEGNLAAVQDHAALLAVMLEQASLDGGQWQGAWLLGLLEDPPQNLWLNRTQAGTGGDDPSEPCVLRAGQP